MPSSISSFPRIIEAKWILCTYVLIITSFSPGNAFVLGESWARRKKGGVEESISTMSDSTVRRASSACFACSPTSSSDDIVLSPSSSNADICCAMSLCTMPVASLEVAQQSSERSQRRTYNWNLESGSFLEGHLRSERRPLYSVPERPTYMGSSPASEIIPRSILT